jgi:hypothetical protein
MGIDDLLSLSNFSLILERMSFLKRFYFLPEKMIIKIKKASLCKKAICPKIIISLSVSNTGTVPGIPNLEFLGIRT